MARTRIAAMEGADLILVNSAVCSAHMKTYGELPEDDPVWAARIHAFGERVRDVVEMELRPSSPGRCVADRAGSAEIGSDMRVAHPAELLAPPPE